jgi:hypothetical protein
MVYQKVILNQRRSSDFGSAFRIYSTRRRVLPSTQTVLAPDDSADLQDSYHTVWCTTKSRSISVDDLLCTALSATPRVGVSCVLRRLYWHQITQTGLQTRIAKFGVPKIYNQSASIFCFWQRFCVQHALAHFVVYADHTSTGRLYALYRPVPYRWSVCNSLGL